MAGPVTFVGRERELSWLAGVLGGDARLVLITGDAGVGKTRFVGEASSVAATAGMIMIRGECLPLAGTLPLLPIALAIEDLARRNDGGLVASALAAAPAFVHEEVARLVPHLAARSEQTARAGQSESWQRGRLFAGLAGLLAATASASRSGLGLVIEDVHWADGETLDFLTFLTMARQHDPVRVVVTCRNDEAPLRAEVTGWLAQARGTAATAEIRLGPLSRAEVADQVAALAGGPVSAAVADELFNRAAGNPFFTEQLVDAALRGGQASGGLRMPPGLPARLTDVLAARADRCARESRALLDALAVAGRPMDEHLLTSVSGLDAAAVGHGLRELAEARLLADYHPGGYRPRHALLAEAVAQLLLPGQRAALHENIARALAGTSDDALAGEAAGHWQAAGRPARELPARVAAAMAAERVFGYAEAAAHWKRAIALWPDVTDTEPPTGPGLPQVYLHAIDALYLSGDSRQAATVAEDAYLRFAADPDPAVAAVCCSRAGFFRQMDDPATGRTTLEESLRLFGQVPASAEHAAAMLNYALSFRDSAGVQADIEGLLRRALEIAEAAGATAQAARAVTAIGYEAFLRGHVAEGQAYLDRGRALAAASGDGVALLRHAVTDSEVQLKLARLQRAVEVAMRGFEAARQVGQEGSWQATQAAHKAATAMIALGRVADAAALIVPLTAGPPDLDHCLVHESRALIDLLNGETDAAARRLRQVRVWTGPVSYVELAVEFARDDAELALWTGCPGDALTAVRQMLTTFTAEGDWMTFCARLLTAGMRACADLAERARARRDLPAVEAATDAADALIAWVGQAGGRPFSDHPSAGAVPAERASWEAEQTRVAGESDPAAWARAAKSWEALGCPHQSAYGLWRQAVAQLEAGNPAAAVTGTLRAAAAAAAGHEPLLAEIRALGGRARISLTPQEKQMTPLPAEAGDRFALTARELAVLRLLAAGHTNAQIGTELYISKRTAGVHVTNIMRKLGVSGRVQAAALAERAGLL